ESVVAGHHLLRPNLGADDGNHCLDGSLAGRIKFRHSRRHPRRDGGKVIKNFDPLESEGCLNEGNPVLTQASNAILNTWERPSTQNRIVRERQSEHLNSSRQIGWPAKTNISSHNASSLLRFETSRRRFPPQQPVCLTARRYPDKSARKGMGWG